MSGEQVYARCLACHALAYDRVGPRHCGLFGRRAGSVPQFSYSPAMKKSGIVWNDKTLDRFLTQPLKMVPCSAMTYDGVADSEGTRRPDRLPQTGQRHVRMRQASAAAPTMTMLPADCAAVTVALGTPAPTALEKFLRFLSVVTMLMTVPQVLVV